jgi:trehalose/maltose hydrolase-like predicted phosphorylase
MSWNLRGWGLPRPERIEPAYLGNGVLGLRIGSDPFDYGRLIFGGLWGYDSAADLHRVVDTPSPFHFAIRLGTGRRAEGLGRVEPTRQELDYLTATLVSEGNLVTPGGLKARYRTEHWVSRALPSLAVMELTLTPEQSGPVSLCPSLPRGAALAACVKVSAQAPAPWGGLGEVRATWQAAGDEGSGVIALTVQESSGAVVAVAASTFSGGGDELVLTWADAASGQPLRVRFYLSAVSTAHHPQPEAQVVRMRRWAMSHTHDELREKHNAAWGEIWKGRVIVEGDSDAQAAVDGSLFHLFCSASASMASGMAPFGLSSDGYSGHVFWDCETWTLPPFVLLDPGVARASLAFRRRGLDAARQYASLYGFRGAMFPWEADGRGVEATPVGALTGVMEHHITPDVAFAFWQYQVANGDEDWLRDATWPVLRNVAEWVCSRVVRSERGYELRHVIGADEFSENVHNSAHTNLVCRRALQVACECARQVGVTPSTAWNEVAAGLVIPRDPKTGLILQQDGWTPAHRAKQADTLLAVYPLGLLENPVDVKKVVGAHVSLDPAQACNVAMGDQINAVVAARIDRRDLAALFFRRGWAPYWIDTWGMFAETTSKRPGCFITGHGGVLQAALLGFTGLQLDHPTLAVHPAALPEGWTRISCERVFVHGRAMRLEAEHGQPAQLLE